MAQQAAGGGGGRGGGWVAVHLPAGGRSQAAVI